MLSCKAQEQHLLVRPRRVGRVSKAGLIATAIVGIGIAAVPAGGGEEVTCGWCGWSTFLSGPHHGFFNGADECGWPQPDWDNVQCSRCGGDSRCHTNTEPGMCHIQCGPGGGDDFAAAAASVRTALAAYDARLLADMMSKRTSGYAVEYNAAGGRIEVIAACDPTIAAAQYGIPVALRPGLERLLPGRQAAAL
jgi:hypothetical protein